MNLDDIEKIVKFLSKSDIHEFELEQDGVKIRLSRGAPATVDISSQARPDVSHTIVMQAAQPVGSVAAQPLAPQSAPALPSHYVTVKAPIVGTFYGKPSPDAEAFVKKGSKVKKGDTLCIIEAMKIMNEIDAPTSGTVRKTFLSDGEVVEYGEALFAIEPD